MTRHSVAGSGWSAVRAAVLAAPFAVGALAGFSVTEAAAQVQGLPLQVDIGQVIQAHPTCPVQAAAVAPMNLQASGGQPSSGYTWTLSAGSTLPAGLALDNLTGVIHGNGSPPNVPGAGDYDFSVDVTDQIQTAHGTVRLHVQTPSAVCGLPVFQMGDTTLFPQAIRNVPYGRTVAVVGGKSPYSNWRVTSGFLPSGLTLDQASGVIRGTPTSGATSSTVTICVNDSSPSTTCANITVPICTSNCTVGGSLGVAPLGDMAASGTAGGPFAPATFQYNLTATAGSVDYFISGVPNWLTPSSTSGTVTTSPTTVSFSVNSNANALTSGTYSATVTFFNLSNGNGTQTRTATLTVRPSTATLSVSPSSGIAASGNKGGPFTPASFGYTLSADTGPVGFTISGLPSWLTASATSGTATTSGTPVTFSVNSSANALSAGTFTATITFTNTSNGLGNQGRTATLTVANPCNPASQIADYNGDCNSDMLFRRQRDGLLSMYLQRGFQITAAQVLGNIGTEFTLVGIGDLNGDGNADMVLRRTDGLVVAYLLNGFQILSAKTLGSVGVEWTLIGVADFDGDGMADLLFRRADGTISLYLMNGTTVRDARILGNIGPEWTFQAAADFDGDGRADMLFRRADGSLSLYLMNGFQVRAAQVLGNIGVEWTLRGVGDFNGDGKADLLMRRADGTIAMYLMNGFQVTSAKVIGNIGVEWTLWQTGDANGDRMSDMLYRRGDGTLSLYLMNGFQVMSSQILGNVGTELTLCAGLPTPRC